MERGPKIFLGITAAVSIWVGISVINKDKQLKCDQAISKWRAALAHSELGISELELAAVLGKSPSEAAITRAASDDKTERSKMERDCGPKRYLNALETAAVEKRIDRMTGL